MEKLKDGDRLTGIAQIWGRLFLGSLSDAERLGRANPLGIKTVISLSETSPCNTQSGIGYIHVPVVDAQAIPLGHFNAILDAMAESIRRGKVLIHCGSGISRAPVLTAAYITRAGCKELDSALQAIAVLRPIIAPSATLIASVREHL